MAKKFFVMSWLSSLTTIELHAPIYNGHPSYINNWPLAKSLTPVCTSKGLSNSKNLSTAGEENLLSSSPKTWWQCSSHFWDSQFFHKSDKVGQSSSFMIPYAMAMHLASTFANGKVIRPRMHLKRFVKLREPDHGRQRELALKLLKNLVAKLIPLSG